MEDRDLSFLLRWAHSVAGWYWREPWAMNDLEKSELRDRWRKLWLGCTIFSLAAVLHTGGPILAMVYALILLGIITVVEACS